MLKVVPWAFSPIDTSFESFAPSSRQGRINSVDDVLGNLEAQTAAKVLILTSQTELPSIENRKSSYDKILVDTLLQVARACRRSGQYPSQCNVSRVLFTRDRYNRAP
jgi:hypothetical protein